MELVVFILIMINLLIFISCNQSNKLYELLRGLGSKEDKIILILGRSINSNKSCLACQSNLNSEQWKALRRVLRNRKDIEFIICLPKGINVYNYAEFPSESFKAIEIKAPSEDIWMIFKGNKLMGEYKGVADMVFIRQAFEIFY